MNNETVISPYQAMGGEQAVRQLVDRFYHLMDTDAEAEHIRDMHPDDLSGSREKLFMFLSGWFGGPPLFEQKYGHPRLRARHFPFEIDEAARDAWMRCMSEALKETDIDNMMREHLMQSLYRLADHMRNV